MEEKLLHPNLLHNNELISLIQERQLNIGNVKEMSRDELMEIFKRHIMPKPQRRQTNKITNSPTSTETAKLTKEVKRIKLSRVNNHVQPMDCTPPKECDNGHKRTILESCLTNCNKRQKIQWP